MPVVKLTARNVDSLPALDGKRTDYMDAILSGFVLRVTPNGARTYGVRYRAGAESKRYTIGDAARVPLAAARDKARELLAKASLGGDPQGDKASGRLPNGEGPTFQFVMDRFFAVNLARLRPATQKSWLGIARRELAPTWGARSAARITRGEVRELVRAIAKDRPYMANRTFELIRRIYTWAMNEDLVVGSPCVGVYKPAGERSRDRTLSRDEIQRIWKCLDAEGLNGLAIKFTFYTAGRRAEVLGLTWRELDLPERLWRIPADRGKSGSAHAVPLSTGALDVLEAAGNYRNGTKWVFPSDKNRGSLQTMHRAIHRIQTASGTEDWTLHDIRRTVRSGLGFLGVPPHVAERVLGHSFRGIVAVYDRHDYVPEMRQGLQLWSDHLQSVTATVATAESAA